jgi:hypothetical protein
MPQLEAIQFADAPPRYVRCEPRPVDRLGLVDQQRAAHDGVPAGEAVARMKAVGREDGFHSLSYF